MFGSGLAIVPLLRDGVVTQHHWLTQGQFLDAAAIALVTLGLLLRFKIGEPWIVAAAGALGLLLHWP